VVAVAEKGQSAPTRRGKRKGMISTSLKTDGIRESGEGQDGRRKERGKIK